MFLSIVIVLFDSERNSSCKPCGTQLHRLEGNSRRRDKELKWFFLLVSHVIVPGLGNPTPISAAPLDPRRRRNRRRVGRLDKEGQKSHLLPQSYMFKSGRRRNFSSLSYLF